MWQRLQVHLVRADAGCDVDAALRHSSHESPSELEWNERLLSSVRTLAYLHQRFVPRSRLEERVRVRHLLGGRPDGAGDSSDHPDVRPMHLTP